MSSNRRRRRQRVAKTKEKWCKLRMRSKRPATSMSGMHALRQMRRGTTKALMLDGAVIWLTHFCLMRA